MSCTDSRGPKIYIFCKTCLLQNSITFHPSNRFSIFWNKKKLQMWLFVKKTVDCFWCFNVHENTNRFFLLAIFTVMRIQSDYMFLIFTDSWTILQNIHKISKGTTSTFGDNSFNVYIFSTQRNQRSQTARCLHELWMWFTFSWRRTVAQGHWSYNIENIKIFKVLPQYSWIPW